MTIHGVKITGTCCAKFVKTNPNTNTSYYYIGFANEEGMEQIYSLQQAYDAVQVGKVYTFLADVNTYPVYNGKASHSVKFTGVDNANK